MGRVAAYGTPGLVDDGPHGRCLRARSGDAPENRSSHRDSPDRGSGVAIVVEGRPPALPTLYGLLLAVLVGREVDRRRLDGCVSEEHADVGDVDAFGAQQLGRAGVAQGVRVTQLAGQLGSGAEALSAAM